MVIINIPFYKVESKALDENNEINSDQPRYKLIFDEFNQKIASNIFLESVDSSWWERFFQEEIRNKKRIWNIYIPSRNLQIKIYPNGNVYYRENKSEIYSSSKFVSENSTEDFKPPNLLEFDFSPKIINTKYSSQNVIFNFRVTDDISGVHFVNWCLSSPSGRQNLCETVYEEGLISGNDLDGIYQGQLQFSQYSETGIWHVNHIGIGDKAGNNKGFSEQDLINMGFLTQLEIINKDDITPPQLLEFDFTPKIIDTSNSSQSITFNFRATDDLSGVRFINWCISAPSLPQGQCNTIYGDPISGNPLDGLYQGIMIFLQYSEPGIWHVDYLSIADKVGNYKIFNEQNLVSFAFPTTFEVISNPFDNTPPQLIEFDFNPKKINTSQASQDVTFTFRVKDDLSGVYFINWCVNNPSWPYLPQGKCQTIYEWNRISGNSLDGVYQGTITFPQYSELGTWYVYHLSIGDRVHNGVVFRERDLINLGFPTKLENSTEESIEKNQSPVVSNLKKLKSDGITSIAETGITIENTVIFKALVTDPDNDQVKLQIELEEYNQPFDGQNLLESNFVSSGSEVKIIKTDLSEGKYHWRARAVDSKGAVSNWQEFEVVGNVDFVVKTIQQAAADLAKEVVNAPYLGDGDTYGGKGWDPRERLYVAPDKIFNGYNYWNNKLRKIDFGAGLDCSGLVQWAYNRSFDPTKSLTRNVIRYDGADGQYRYNSKAITENDLRSGDLLFLDKNNDGYIDHVAMYVGESDGYDIVEAFSPAVGIIPSNKSEFKTRKGFDENKSFRRVVLSPSIGGQVKASSPIDLIVTEPDGFTITPTTTIRTDEEYLREVPGELYYYESELGSDDRPEDMVYWPVQKIGDYIIKVIPEAGISPTETYNLEFQTGDKRIILAENIPINQIPSEGYGVSVKETGIVSTFIPVEIDIKLGNFPNSINLNSKGTTPVAIFGSNTFNVYQINLNSVTLAGAHITSKSNGQLMASYDDINKDGFIDLVVHFTTRELNLTSNDNKAYLEGQLISGEIIKGSDSIRIVP
jgi:cell wall-associated NlpC family hydrolase